MIHAVIFFFFDLLHSSTLRSDGDGCTGVQLEDAVDFNVTVTLTSCEGLQNGETRMWGTNMASCSTCLFYLYSGGGG